MINAAQKAIELLESLGYTGPKDMTVEQIAWASGLIVTRKEMSGCEGRILMNETEAIISINSQIDYQPKINFILAHEIGHAIMHRKIQPAFTDTDKTLAEWYSNGIHETEANAFAAELLMPSALFLQMVKRKKLSLELVENVSEFFGASKTATFLRYRDLGDFPVMIIFIENGVIKWKSSSHDFPYKWLVHGSKVPPYTVAGDYYYNNVKETMPAKVDATEWFPEDYNLQNENGQQKLFEQCFPATRNGILTCLWTP